MNTTMKIEEVAERYNSTRGMFLNTNIWLEAWLVVVSLNKEVP